MKLHDLLSPYAAALATFPSMAPMIQNEARAVQAAYRVVAEDRRRNALPLEHNTERGWLIRLAREVADAHQGTRMRSIHHRAQMRLEAAALAQRLIPMIAAGSTNCANRKFSVSAEQQAEMLLALQQVISSWGDA